MQVLTRKAEEEFEDSQIFGLRTVPFLKKHGNIHSEIICNVIQCKSNDDSFSTSKSCSFNLIDISNTKNQF